jgi:hypothetical protein
MHPLRQVELERLGFSYGTLILVRYLFARAAEESGHPANWLAEAKWWVEHNVKSTIPAGLTDDESIFLVDKALSAVRFVFSGIKIESAREGQSRNRA